MVDLCTQKLTRVASLGDRALFLSDDRCLCVSSMDFPSISSNSIYFSMPEARKPVIVHSLNDGSFESLSEQCLEHDKPAMTAPVSVQPFTLADQLVTYCHHREWTRGLMFHEFYFIPSCWENLKKRIAMQDSDIVVPKLRATVDQLKRHEVPDLFAHMRIVSRISGNTPKLTA
ncbi:hypothetical protein ACP70R_007127 [Stipagrostis hirtigluma subsp. patula]